MEALFPLLIGLACFAFAIWFIFVLPANMARDRNRSPGLWVLISLVGSPLLAILLLMALGPDHNAPNRS